MPVRPSAIPGGGPKPLIFAYTAPDGEQRVRHPALTPTTDEDALYAPDATGYVISDLRRLSDLALVLVSGRPTLFVLDDVRDLTHLLLLIEHRALALTPHDAVLAQAGSRTRAHPAWPTLADLAVESAAEWLERPAAARLPEPLDAFAQASKIALVEFGRRCTLVPLPRLQHFWRPVGEVGALACIVTGSASAPRVGHGGVLHNLTPTLLVVDAAARSELRALTLAQSTVLAAPFALAPAERVDHLAADLADIRPEPFHLHDVVTMTGTYAGRILGVLYGEYVV